MTIIKLKKNKHLIEISKEGTEKKLRYDLKKKYMLRKNEKGIWQHVCHQYPYFMNCRISDIECEDEKFRKMIEVVQKLNPDCISISTFISRLDEGSIFENYIEQGVDFEIMVYRDYYGGWNNRSIEKPLSYYNVNTINFFKEKKIKLTRNIERIFGENKKILEEVIQLFYNKNMEKEKIKKLFDDLMYSSYRIDPFQQLINDYKYEIKSLINYIYNYLEPFEGIRFSDAVNFLKDYNRMASAIGRNIKKYPKYLKSIHDIISINYNVYKEEYDEILFKKVQPMEMEYIAKHEHFCIVLPKNSKDIVKEGTSLNHCVGSYVNQIIEKKTIIMFLRSTKELDTSLITLELKQKAIIQAKGSYNRKPCDEERKFLEKYCKRKKIALQL